ncbi:calnexin [Gautieria morchelliformis]|nr:calnexin [Gautieria morchelliformis]
MRSVALSALVVLASSTFAVADDEELSAKFVPTTIKAPFLEQFTDTWTERWTPSGATKKTPVGGETFSYVGKWEVEAPIIPVMEGEKGLVAKTTAAHHAISAPLKEPVGVSTEPLVVQYEVKFQNGGNCGGGYMKLLEEGYQADGEAFSDKTPWSIMFGPDLTCPGSKVHFIFNHLNQTSGEYEEKHLKYPPVPTIERNTVLYTLVVYSNNTYEVSVDGKSVNNGSLLESFDPPVNPLKIIADPDDKKPEDWVDASAIPDKNATKAGLPEDWDEDAPYEIPDDDAKKPEGWLDDEPDTVPDPDAEKPEEWDDEEDGDWIAPSIPNPKCDEAPGCGEWKRPLKANPAYKGKWMPPFIDNPDYKGPWAPRQIPNPNYFEDLTPALNLKKIGGVGIEIWTMTSDILFSNIYIGHSIEDAKKLAAETFDVKHALETAKSKDDGIKFDDETQQADWKEDPVAFIREKVFSFVELAKVDPVLAFKTKPETGAALTGALLTLFGMLGAVFGLVGGQQKPVTKSSKKTDAPTPDDKKKETAPVAPAGGEKHAEGGAKKRK